MHPRLPPGTAREGVFILMAYRLISSLSLRARCGGIPGALGAALLMTSLGAVPEHAAQAQMMGMHNNPHATEPKGQQAPPPSLPGSKPASHTPVPPPDKSLADMQPNDALFDAINRGDVPAARDALSRGAQLEARNVLGMTPLELSVDLGRNEISFLLLSMRPPPDSSAVISGPAPKPVTTASKTTKIKGSKSHHEDSAAISTTQPKEASANETGFLGFNR
ncbi:ankyrin repeat domain-containing protein [Granulibacter bethesdensis]|nr:ankyrin repeat domain-containing protein [Granulibacter bethesdensis]